MPNCFIFTEVTHTNPHAKQTCIIYNKADASTETVDNFHVNKSGLLASSQHAFRRSCDRQNWWRFLRGVSCP